MSDPRRPATDQWYWDGLASGELLFQRCLRCASPSLPPTEHCTFCLSPELVPERASGGAKLISWVIYHVSPSPDFADKVPYNVALVELTEGPRTITNLVGVEDWTALHAGMPLELVIDSDNGVQLARFQPSRGG